MSHITTRIAARAVLGLAALALVATEAGCRQHAACRLACASDYYAYCTHRHFPDSPASASASAPTVSSCRGAASTP